MASIKNYKEQNAFAKKELIKTIKSGHKIALLHSEGARGKYI